MKKATSQKVGGVKAVKKARADLFQFSMSKAPRRAEATTKRNDGHMEHAAGGFPLSGPPVPFLLRSRKPQAGFAQKSGEGKEPKGRAPERKRAGRFLPALAPPTRGPSSSRALGASAPHPRPDRRPFPTPRSLLPAGRSRGSSDTLPASGRSPP